MSKPLWMERFAQMTKSELRAYQLKRVRWLVRYAYERTALYKRLYDSAGIKPDDLTRLDDVAKLPITTKANFADSQHTVPPFGEHLAVTLDKIVRINISTGVKGPAIEPSTEKDVAVDTEAAAYALKLAGVRPGDVFVVTSNYSYVPSGLVWQLAGERVGCATIPVGVGGRERLVDTLAYTRATVLNAFTTYCFEIAETAREKGLDAKKDFALRILFIGGEPGGGFASVRKRLRDIYGDVNLFERYGTAELRLLGMECPTHAGFHIPEPVNYVEIVDAESGEPVSPGEKGVIVASSLHREGWPIVRFRTEDISYLDEVACSCGLRFRRLMGILGKTGGLVRAKGVLIYPEPIAEVVSEFPEFGEFQVIVTRPMDVDEVSVMIECKGEPDPEGRRRLLERLRSVMTITPEVKFVKPGSLPPDAKLNRIVDRRQPF